MVRLIILLVLFPALMSAGCQPGEADTATAVNEHGSSVLSRLEKEAKEFSVFELEAGECVADNTVLLNLGGGDDVEMQVTSALAINAIEITSLKGDQVSKRNGYTLYIANYDIDPTQPGMNPDDEHAKIEMTMLALDSTLVSTGLFGKPQDGNLVVGPNLFHNGKTYPMKNNFIGGVLITSNENGRLCGEIRLKSKFDVKIIGRFDVPLVEPSVN